MRGTIPLKGGIEYDMLTNWRHKLCHPPSLVHYAKRKYNRRVRRDMNRQLAKELGEWTTPKQEMI